MSKTVSTQNTARNLDWTLHIDNNTWNHDQIQIALLADIRAELKRMNQKLSPLECPNFLAIPRVLKRISANTAKPKAKKPKLRVVNG